MEAVMAMPALRKVSSNDKRRQPKQNPSETFAKKFFADILDEACEKEAEQTHAQTIQVQTTGYTRNALPFYNIVKMREYC